MSDEFTTFAQRAVIKVCGVGGGGGNAVNRMIAAGLRDVEFIVVNTDAQALKSSPSPKRLQIGIEMTGGLGSGAKPEIGKQAAIEDREHLEEALRGADMVFLTAGLGGGTGTGASPVVAEIAAASGALTIGIVTLPFAFEGKERMENALQGLDELEPLVNSIIVVPNDRVAQLGQNKITLVNAFQQADEVLHNGVRAITEVIMVHGLINVDFADVRTVMEAGGRALMGIGRADGERRSARAAEEAIVCPLLEQSNINGATGVIINIRGGRDIGMREVEEAVSTVKKAAHPDARIIFGAVVEEEEQPELQVMVIAAGFSPEAGARIARRDRGNPAEDVHREEEKAPEVNTNEATSEPIVAPVIGPGRQTEFLPDQEEVQEQEEEPAAESAGHGDFEKPTHQRLQEEEEDLRIPSFLRNRKKNK